MEEGCVADFGLRVWDAALALVGVPFRLHGRDVASGLDCVGLVAAAYARAGLVAASVPDRYRMRETNVDDARAWIAAAGLSAVTGAGEVGDVVLSDMGGGQLHLMIAGAGATIHAHAGLRRVVEMPGAPPGCVVGRWRWQG
jgi:murein DD-endopeptidase / murein LD-carboxypeptidase